MSRGPGYRQRAFLRALRRVGPSGVVRVVPPGATPTDANCRRISARRLVLAGRARAIYLRTPTTRGRCLPILYLTTVDSSVEGDAWLRASRDWVSLPPLSIDGLAARLQAPVLSYFAGTDVSTSTANRIAREYREARGKVP